MNIEQSLSLFGLVPEDKSLPEIRTMLEKEAELERTGQQREDDLALLCCVQLFSRGNLEDVLRIWGAKRSGFDLGCYLDVQFLCGAGLEKTKTFLISQQSKEATEAFEYLMKCEQSGDFEEFSPENHLQRYREYFRVT